MAKIVLHRTWTSAWPWCESKWIVSFWFVELAKLSLHFHHRCVRYRPDLLIKINDKKARKPPAPSRRALVPICPRRGAISL